MPVKRGTLVSLDPVSPEAGRLPLFAQVAWLHLLRFALDAAGVRATIRIAGEGLDPALTPPLLAGAFPECTLEFSPGDPRPGPDEACVHLSGSEVLSTRLLRRFRRIHVAPSALPLALEPRLYWHARASGQFASALTASLRALGGTAPWAAANGYPARLQPARRRASLISSIFAGDEYLPGFLENSAALEGYGACEHFLVRAGSPGDEHGALIEHVRQWPCAVYINLTSDPGLYEVWNLCTRLATAPYHSSANIDDRRAPAHVTTLARRLDAEPEVAVAHGALRVTQTRNLPWSESTDCPVWYSDGGDRTYTADELLQQGPRGLRDHNRPHCMPLWRRELHAFHGGFREREWGPSADWEFWLRVGTAGVRFAQVGAPLGLYLKDAASYWQRGSAGGGYNERILERHAPALLEGAKPAADDRPLGLCFADVHEQARCGAWFELVVTLLACARRLSAPALTSGQGSTSVAWLRRMGQTYLGVADLPERVADDPRGALCGVADIGSALTALIELLHGGDQSTGDPARSLPARVLWGALVDVHELGRDPRALLGCALLLRRQGDAAGEQALLTQVYGDEGRHFWCCLQDVYRFTVPLDEIARRVNGVQTCGAGEHECLERMHLAYFPDFRGNPYQRLLYGNVVAAGGQVRPLATLADIDALEPSPACDNVLHIHWLQGVFADVGASGFTARGLAFLEQLRRARERGFRICWTIHNELNHESVFPRAERLFRRMLARRVDRVYVHHPLVPQLLDWFPADRRPWLVEHGPFPVGAGAGVGRLQEQNAARERLDLPEDAFVLVSAGIVRDYKALDAYIPAIRARMTADPRLRFVVVGQVASHAAREALATLPPEQLVVRNEKVADAEYEAWLRAADFAFFSYRAILTSGSLFHALSLGVPVIAPKLGTLPAYVVDGWNGYLYASTDTLETVLARCSAAPPARTAALGHNAALTAGQLRWSFC